MNRIEREKHIVALMIKLYCRHKLHKKEMPAEYIELTEYAWKRLDNCKFGINKSSCKRCPVHCYRKDKREMIKRVMKWVGPRMLFYDPISTLRHMF